MNPLVQLGELGQSPWYDYIQRSLITSGELKVMIETDGLRGMTSNPSIFEKAIGGSADYNPSLKQALSEGMGVKEIYEALAIRDIQDAADLFYSVYEKSQAKDGYVCLEVAPDLAHHTEETFSEARRLFKVVGRENVMIKVPGTREGIPAIERLLGEGININITLLFSVEAYEQVALAYISGLEAFALRGGDLSRLGSVASFFVSRIDSLIDSQLLAIEKETVDPGKKALIKSLVGKVAIANAKIAYLKFREIFWSSRFLALKNKGAKVQRLLWASTSTKNPQYPDTYYIDTLIAPETVNTMPAATFVAFRDHGKVAAGLLTGIDEAKETMAHLADCGIDIHQATDKLLSDGVRIFSDAFDQLMGTISKKRKALMGDTLGTITASLGPADEGVAGRLKTLRQQNFVRRLWAKDSGLWHQDPAHQKIIQNALGWLQITEQQTRHRDAIQTIAESARGFKHALLLGMGGSSLCPEVFQSTFGAIPGYPKLHVLDSTNPAQIRNIEKQIDLAKTLFIVASKSGSTIEPLMFYEYFLHRLREIKGDQAGGHFIAITDPGSPLEHLAREGRFKAVLPGVPDIGGRYSALSNFGMVPAAIMGIDVARLLDRAHQMRHHCDAYVPAQDNPGVVLGVILGEMAKRGKDKATFILSPGIRPLGAWLEQLIAESTGKEGKGIIPINDEPIGLPSVYGHDRFFVYLRHTPLPDPSQDEQVALLEKAGHPVIRLNLPDLIQMGEAFFLWEMATAVAGSILGINPFDQPNVQESKAYTQTLLREYEEKGCLPEEKPILIDGGIRIYSGEADRKTLSGIGAFNDIVARHLSHLKPGDYLALTAYLASTEDNHHALQEIRRVIRDKRKVATTLGYGPRFLHSTGQLHKGGPNTGLFIQITSDDAEDVPIPEKTYSFGILNAAQASGDFLSLSRRDRRIIRIHLTSDVATGLHRLGQAIVEI